MSKIVLTEDAEVANGLTYKQGCLLLQMAGVSPASKHLTFHLELDLMNKGKWKLMSSPNEVMKAFLAKPSDFVVELPKEWEEL